MSLRWQFEAKLFTSNYTNRVVHVLKGFFYIVSFIHVKTNLYFWSRSYSKQPLLWPLLRKQIYTTVYFP